tara:strand:- start:686 stop:940 length:255 start_codon:yes stop_codon:yes gene_type:complete
MKKRNFQLLIGVIWLIILMKIIGGILSQYYYVKDVFVNSDSMMETIGWQYLDITAWSLFWGVFATAILYQIVPIDVIPNLDDSK